MSVVSYKRRPAKRGASGEFAQPTEIVEVFDVRVDSLTQSIVDIVNAPGVAYGSAHPDASTHKATRFAVAAADESGLIWAVSWTYKVPQPGQQNDPSSGIPEDVWRPTGGTSSIAVYKDKDGTIMANSAGDPLEGLEAETTTFAWTLTRAYASKSAWATVRDSHNNRVNSDTWDGQTARKWRVTFEGAEKRFLVVGNTVTYYWEVTWKVNFNPDTWDLSPWDIGFNERCDNSGVSSGTGTNRKTILGKDQRPVKQPVALSNGVALPPGTPPVALNFRYYKEAAFTATFGTPG